MYLLFFTSFLSASFAASWSYCLGVDNEQSNTEHSVWDGLLSGIVYSSSFFLFLGNSEDLTQPFWTAVEMGWLYSSKFFFHENGSSGSYFCTVAGRSEPIILIHKGWNYFFAAFSPSLCHALSIFINLQWVTSSSFLSSCSGSGEFSEIHSSSFVLTFLNNFL